MENVKKITFSKKCDPRGNLIPIQSYLDVDFNIARIFFIKNMDNFPRGFHSHRKSVQVLVPIAGSFDLELTDGRTTNTWHLDKDNEGVQIPLHIWLKMLKFSPGCIILVVCSYRYDEDEYVRNYGDFLREHSKFYNLDQCSTPIYTFNMDSETEAIKPQVMAQLDSIISAKQFVLGPQLAEFEQNFAAYIGSNHCVGVSNGTAAMIAALKSLQAQSDFRFDEVIIQGNTYIAAALACEFCQIPIKIMEIDDSLNLDLDQLENYLLYEEQDVIDDIIPASKNRVVIAVHLYGSCPDMNRLIALQKRFEFGLIEDAAQAHGSTFEGKKLGSFGDIGCFSFYPSKNLGCFGEGGCIVTNNQQHHDFIRKYRNYGSEQRYHWEIKGTNERMHNIQAAILNLKLPLLDEQNRKRNLWADLYDKELASIPEIVVPPNPPGLYRNYHLYVILLPNSEFRAKLMEYLRIQNIHCAIHYPGTFYKSPAFQEYNHLTTRADDVCQRILSLPMYPELGEANVMRVCKTIREFFAQE